jgi:TRAP-type C4-dicarboxylate transport system substrate-binding protein
MTLAGFAGSTMAPVAAKELRLASYYVAKHPIERFMLAPWRKEIARRSGGSLMIETHLNLDPVAMYKLAADGEFDLSSSLPGYTSDLFPRTGILELPGVAETAEEAVDKFWDAFPLIEPEWKGVKLLALWTNHRNFLMFRGKPIRSIANIKGLKIRVPSKGKGDIIEALGMRSVFMPIERVYKSLQGGEIDGLVTSPSAVRPYKLNEVVIFYWGTLPVGRATFFLVINRKAFESLTAEHKALIEETTGRELSKKFARFFTKAAKGGLSILRRSTTISVVKLPPEEQKKGAAILEKVRTDWIDKLERTGIPARRIAEAMGVGR